MADRTGQSMPHGQDARPAPGPDPGLLGHRAMEFRRVSRMNKHQLWSICVAWCRDRAAAAAVLSRGLADAWAGIRTGTGTAGPVTASAQEAGDLPLSAQITRTVYRCVLAAAADSLAADTLSTEQDAGQSTDPCASLGPEEVSLYVMASYSPLPTPYACELLGIPGDGAGVLARVSQVLLRDGTGHR